MEEKQLDQDICRCTTVHEEVIQTVKAQMPAKEQLDGLADTFKVFGDLTRIRILSALTDAVMCVCDIAALLEMSQSAISHQLRVLRQARLVKYKKTGKVVYYSLDDEHVRQIIECGLLHINEK